MMLSLSSLTLWSVVAGTMLTAVSASLVGCLTFLQKKSLSGDAISHALLPGLCISFLLVGKKSVGLFMMGAFVMGMVAFLAIDYLPRWSKLKKDTANSLVLSCFFGVGLLLLTYIQHSGNEQQVGLQQFLFGSAASMQRSDLQLFTGMAISLLLVLIFFARGFKALIFDRAFAQMIGWPVGLLDVLLRVLVVVAVVVGIQSVGLMLMTAMLIAPAAAARFWSERLTRMWLIAAFLGGVSAMGGTFASYSVHRLPTGPCIVLLVTLLALISFMVAPKRGWIAQAWARHCYRRKVLRENLLKLFYELDNEESQMDRLRTMEELLARYPLRRSKMRHALHRLSGQGLLSFDNEAKGWKLTAEGARQGEEVHQLHLLWEAYLIHYLRIAPDHVHEDAESIEHLLTPELRAELEAALGKA